VFRAFLAKPRRFSARQSRHGGNVSRVGEKVDESSSPDFKAFQTV